MKTPTVGFVSLGCPKALVDSERIITRLRAEGYAMSGSYEGADLVVVNTCGFIDAAVQESLDAIGEALAENGRVIVTGCLGARTDHGENLVAKVHPKVLAVTGPDAADEVLARVHAHLPQPHDPFMDLVPPAGIKLTPRHYAYLKIAEGCNHRCTFCIIPSMRGDLVSRPIGQVMREAENLVKQGVREILVISQDTSAYGVDVRHKLDFVGRVRARDGEDLRVDLGDQVLAAVGARAEATGDDHATVLGKRLADRIERLLHRRVDETAGIDHHQVRAPVAAAHRVALGAQLGDDPLRIDQRLGAAERNKTDGGCLHDKCHDPAGRADGAACLSNPHRRRGRLGTTGGAAALIHHFFSGGNGNAVNIERACLLTFSCICMNRSLLCSM